MSDRKTQECRVKTGQANYKRMALFTSSIQECILKQDKCGDNKMKVSSLNRRGDIMIFLTGNVLTTLHC